MSSPSPFINSFHVVPWDVNHMTISKDGSTVFMQTLAGADGMIAYDLRTGKEKPEWERLFKSGHRFRAISQDGSILITYSNHHKFVVWDTSSCEMLRGLEGALDNGTITLSPNNRVVVAWTYDKGLCAWDLRTGRCVRPSRHVGFTVNRIAITGDSTTAVAYQSLTRSNIYVWDIFPHCTKALALWGGAERGSSVERFLRADGDNAVMTRVVRLLQ